MRGDFKLSFEFNFRCIIIIIIIIIIIVVVEGSISRESDIKCRNVPRSTTVTEKKKPRFLWYIKSLISELKLLVQI